MVIVVGLIGGALARLIVPGTDTPDIDWIPRVVPMVAAAVLVGIYVGVFGKKPSV